MRCLRGPTPTPTTDRFLQIIPYSQFTSISKVKEAFGLKTQEGGRFIPVTESIKASATLTAYLEESLPLASSASQKARSEGIIYPVLLEVRRILNRQISLFSGEDFPVDEAVGLNGMCDFLLSRSPEVLEIEAPCIVIVEAKKADLQLHSSQTLYCSALEYVRQNSQSCVVNFNS
ncbi:MAG: hypothetical protein ACYTXA_31350 [Nostoc sp.]